jgi:CRP-like cAMP-binding protein
LLTAYNEGKKSDSSRGRRAVVSAISAARRHFGALERWRICDGEAQLTPKPIPFDPKAFLNRVGHGKTTREYRGKQPVFSQGDAADSVFYIQSGRVKLTVVSSRGKEAVIGILDKGTFFGEGALAGQPLRVSSATTIQASSIVRVDKATMVGVLHKEPDFAEVFIAHLLSRNVRFEEDLVDQLFNSSEKRLARLLLLLAHFGKEGKPETVIPRMSQETLASMVGTTRSRISYFMNRFRKLGFIHYNGGLEVHSSLLTIVLRD